MIPTLIHYCWFGGGLMPSSHKNLLKQWKKRMPEYEFRLWDESSFDINSNSYVANAYNNRKFAFVSDYVRLQALYTEGGFYLDTDVELFRSLDEMRQHDFVSTIEYFPGFENFRHLLDHQSLPLERGSIVPGMGILCAFMGATAGNALIKKMIDYYDGLQPPHPEFKGVIIDGAMAREAVNFGFRYENCFQEFQPGMVVYPSSVGCSLPEQLTASSLLLHHCAQSWQTQSRFRRIVNVLDKLHIINSIALTRIVKRLLISR